MGATGLLLYIGMDVWHSALLRHMASGSVRACSWHGYVVVVRCTQRMGGLLEMAGGLTWAGGELRSSWAGSQVWKESARPPLKGTGGKGKGSPQCCTAPRPLVHQVVNDQNRTRDQTWRGHRAFPACPQLLSLSQGSLLLLLQLETLDPENPELSCWHCSLGKREFLNEWIVLKIKIPIETWHPSLANPASRHYWVSTTLSYTKTPHFTDKAGT